MTQASTNPGTLSETRDAIRSSRIAIEIVQTVRVTTQVNIIDFYLSLDETARSLYWNTDLSQFADFGPYGCHYTWERPYAYLLAWLDDGLDVTEPLCPPRGVSHVETLDVEDRITHRSGVRSGQADAEWTEEDFETLLTAVPWLAPADEANPERAALIARIPGPADRPLW